MNLISSKTLLTAALCLGTSPFVAQAQSGDVEALRAELKALRTEVAELRAKQESDQKKTYEEVYKDAQERAGAGSTQMLAGISDKGKIFFRSADDSFTANLSGQIQFRYIWNSLSNSAGARDDLSGFQMRRAKLGISGKMYKDWGYKFVLATNRGTGPGGGNTFSEDVYITYKFDDNWSLLAGTNKLPFARQEIISSTRQVGVDRGLVTEFFTLNRSDQFAVNYKTDDIRATLALSDGANADFTGFGAAGSNDLAVTGRADWMAIGDDWDNSKHEFGGVDSDALFFGGAVHYETSPVTSGPVVAWTGDVLYKTGDLGLTAAVFGHHSETGAGVDYDQFGVYTQGDYKITSNKDIFARWEYIDDDDAAGTGADPLQAVTVGLNHHFNKHLKLTTDVIWIYDGDNQSTGGSSINGGELSSGLGLSSTGFGGGSGHGDQVAFRLQLQLLF